LTVATTLLLPVYLLELYLQLPGLSLQLPGLKPVSARATAQKYRFSNLTRHKFYRF